MEVVRSVVVLRDGMAGALLEKHKLAAALTMYRENLDLLRRVNYPGDLEARDENLLRNALRQ